MPRFQYVAETVDGAVHRGYARAGTISQARRDLEDKGLFVSDLVTKPGLGEIEVTKSRIKRTDLMHLSRQLAAFIKAGIPILDAISELRDESEKRAVKRVLSDIAADLRAGSMLSEAVDKHPQDFPPFYRGILRSAELTGQLDVVLDQLSTYLARDAEARRKIKGALTYPAMLVLLSTGTIIVMMLVVLPSYESLFSSYNAELPAVTRALMNASNWFTSHVMWLAGGVVALIVCGYVGLRFRSGRKARDWLLLRTPIIGSTIRYSLIERFARILASMVNAGIPLPEAMRVATESLRNLVFEDQLVIARQEMLQGAGLSSPLRRTLLFPGMASQMIRVGENTGTLDSQLVVAAKFYESELDFKVKRMTNLIEPLVILILGGVVGVVALAVVSAMYGIFSAVQP